MALIDFQTSRYVSPALDLSYFLFSSIDKKLRDRHYQDLILVYHNTVVDTLLRCGVVDVEHVFPLSALLDQLKRFGRFGIAMALMALPALLVNAQDIPDEDEVERIMALEDKENTTEYRELLEKWESNAKKSHERIREVVLDGIEYGYM